MKNTVWEPEGWRGGRACASHKVGAGRMPVRFPAPRRVPRASQGRFPISERRAGVTRVTRGVVPETSARIKRGVGSV